MLLLCPAAVRTRRFHLGTVAEPVADHWLTGW